MRDSHVITTSSQAEKVVLRWFPEGSHDFIKPSSARSFCKVSGMCTNGDVSIDRNELIPRMQFGWYALVPRMFAAISSSGITISFISTKRYLEMLVGR